MPLNSYSNASEALNESTPRGGRKVAEALAEVMTEGAFINGALIGISENRHVENLGRDSEPSGEPTPTPGGRPGGFIM